MFLIRYSFFTSVLHVSNVFDIPATLEQRKVFPIGFGQQEFILYSEEKRNGKFKIRRITGSKLYLYSGS